jgi:hypothetical protein
MSKVNTGDLYRAIRDLDSAMSEIAGSGVDKQFESEVCAYIENAMDLIDFYLDGEENE